MQQIEDALCFMVEEQESIPTTLDPGMHNVLDVDQTALGLSIKVLLLDPVPTQSAIPQPCKITHSSNFEQHIKTNPKTIFRKTC